jgi:hypothetical protein
VLADRVIRVKREIEEAAVERRRVEQEAEQTKEEEEEEEKAKGKVKLPDGSIVSLSTRNISKYHEGMRVENLPCGHAGDVITGTVVNIR